MYYIQGTMLSFDVNTKKCEDPYSSYAVMMWKHWGTREVLVPAV